MAKEYTLTEIYSAQPDSEPEKRTFTLSEVYGEPKRTRTTVAELGRQLGLTARAGVNAAANTVGIFSNPIASALSMATGRNVPTAQQMAESGMSAIGLPSPENAQERVVQDVTTMGLGTGVMGGLANAAAKTAVPLVRNMTSVRPSLPEIIQGAGKFLGQGMAQQTGAAVGAGAAGGITREQGGGDLLQFAAAIGGGLAGGVAGGGIGSMMGRSAAAPQKLGAADIEIKLAQAIQDRTGTTWQEIPQQLRAQLVNQAKEAFDKSGKLPAGAAARAVDFQKVGIDPMTPWLTRDPVAYSKMMNLRGTDAGVPIQRSIADANTKLIEALNKSAPVSPGTPLQRGEQVISELAAKDKAMSNRVSAQYDAYKATVGKDLEVPIQNYASDLTALVDDFGAAFPSSIRSQLEKVGMFGGSQLKTVTLADTENWLKRMNAVPASNQAEKAAQSAVRGVIARMQTELASTGDLAGEAAAAAQAARGAASARFKWQDAVPLVKDIITGDAAPDRLIEQTVLSRSATTKDIQNLMMSLGESSRNAVRAEVVDTIKRAALSGASDETGVVSQAALNKALAAFPKEKLTALLGKESTDELMRLGRVASYMQKFPAGESVNTSKTAGVLLGALDRFGSKIPVIGPMVGKPMQDLLQQRQVSQLMSSNIAAGANRLAPILPRQSGYGPGIPALTAGMLGLMSSPIIDNREDDK